MSQIAKFISAVRTITNIRQHSHDEKPSLVEREIALPAPQPSPKRKKIDPASSRTTIASKARNHIYTDSSELVSDLDLVGESLLQELEEKFSNGDVSKDAVAQGRERVSTMKGRFHSLVVGEMFLRPNLWKPGTDASEADGDQARNGPTGLSSGSNRTVLTLCGGDRSAKQLFSSLAKMESSGKALTDTPLPNGIITTTLMPVHDLGEVNEKVPSFGERYHPPSSLKQLSPPRPISRHVATRSMNVGWHDPIEALANQKEPSPRDPYFVQNLPTGKWLSYNVAPSTDQMTSPTSKRRFRDRALSTGEPQSAIDAETTIAHEKAKEDALFRSAFSSFAPSRDDQGAIVSEQEKNRVWWTKYGEPQMHGHLEAVEGVLEYSEDAMEVDDVEALDEKLIEDGLTNWDSYNDARTPFDKEAEEGKGASELLQEISELLEILHSYQRIRHTTQPSSSSSSQPLQGSKAQQSNLPPEISTPSDAEFEVYENLKTQLVEVIATLPPYMLSKLDSNRLRPLRVNTRIQIPGRHQKGTLEDDMTSTRPRPSTYGTYQPSYSTTGSTRGGYTASPGQTSAHRPSYSNQTPVQRPAANASYSRYSGQTASTPQYGANSVRSAYNQYPQQRTPSSYSGQYGYPQTSQTYSQYGSSYRPSGMQQVSSYSQQFPSSQRVPPGTPSTQYSQQRPPLPPSYSYNQAGSGRSPSAQGVGGYGGQNSASGTRPNLPHQHSNSFGGSQSPQHQVNGVGMDGPGRQSPMPRPGSTDLRKQHSLTPQPQPQSQPPPSGDIQRQRNGTPTGRPNGVTA